MDKPSGNFVLRMEPALHGRLRRAARKARVSLNEHCVRVLASHEAASLGGLEEVVARGVAQLGVSLVAVAIFGSYARGEACEGSDVDVLFVVDGSLPITRALYAPWDGDALLVDGYPVEPHFVGLPDANDRITGLWAEVAVEGAVIFDPELRLSRWLAHVRRAIVDGLMVRRSAQGQPYWTVA
jgi:hypothetical protein